ncbi:hypothetical protein ACJJI3_22880 [Microbulbifer sp. ZKSA004]|uniref:hypothetical protein n=1 Tax=Microbulbifer sp. ZKSA004 TaxID=3243389 RepID=UPI004039E7B0
MSEQEMAFLLVALVCFLCVVIYSYKKTSKPCEQCGGKMSLVKIRDPAGNNINPKITLSFYVGRRNLEVQKLWGVKDYKVLGELASAVRNT